MSVSAILCTCGTALDPDAPGGECTVCHGEQPSPVPSLAERRPSARAPLSALGRIAARGAIISDARGGAYRDGFVEAVALEHAEVEA